MHQTEYHGPPKVIVAITSMSALLVGEQSRREVRIPRRDQLPANVPWLKDKSNAERPAIIGITGRVMEVRDIDEKRVSQWNVSCFPNDKEAHERCSRQDLQDLFGDMHKELTRIGVMPGAWYTAYFSVPMYGGNNYFDSTFQCAGMERRAQEKRLRESWNPVVMVRRALGLIRPVRDPWLEDEAGEALVRRTIKDHGAKILGKIWDKWVQNPDVGPTLRMLRVPIDDPKQTVYRHGDPHQRIFDNLSPISRRTMFMDAIPDDFEDAIERKLGDKA